MLNVSKMAVRVSKDEFLLRAIKKHGNRFDYSKINYKGTCVKVCIICPEHGEFWQTPEKHMNGQGCPKCIGRFLTREEFITKSIGVHGNKYDYSKVEIKKKKDKVCIICPEHGEFWQLPYIHMKGHGCPKCAKIVASQKQSQKMRLPKDTFITRAKEIHGDKYDYSKVEYNTTNDKICIICPEHGEFWQRVSNHIIKRNGCPKCHPNYNKTTEDFIAKGREVHGNKYDYSKVEYVNNTTKVCIICPEHGEFWQRPNSHLSRKQGCPHCANSKLEMEYENILKTNNTNYEKQKKIKDIKDKIALRFDFYNIDNNTLIECQGIQHIRDCSEVFGEKYFLPLLKRDKIKYDKTNELNIKLIYIVEKQYYKEFIKFGGIYNKNNTFYIKDSQVF